MRKLCHCSSRSPKYVEVCHFTLLFCRWLVRNVQIFKTHVHSQCFCWLTFVWCRFCQLPAIVVCLSSLLKTTQRNTNSRSSLSEETSKIRLRLENTERLKNMAKSSQHSRQNKRFLQSLTWWPSVWIIARLGVTRLSISPTWFWQQKRWGLY